MTGCPTRPGDLRRPMLAAALGILLVTFAAAPAGAQLPPFTILESEDHVGTAYVGSTRGEGSYAGAALAGGEDVNGDHLPDLLAGAPGGFAGRAGRAYLVLGRPRRPRLVSLPEGEGIVTIVAGQAGADGLGRAVALPGDVDGDGVGDLLIGAPASAEAAGGAAYLIFGRGFLPSRLTLSTDLPRLGLRWRSAEAGEAAGSAVAGVGDINGDGFLDLAVGDPHASTARGKAGRVYVIFGGRALREALEKGNTFDLRALPAERGLAIDGPADGSLFGASVSAAGDLDQDGIADLAAGAPGFGPGGAAYIVYGRKPFGAAPDLAVPDGARASRLATAGPGEELGFALAGGRDVSGDGKPDLVLGAPGARRDGGLVAGAAVLIHGGEALRGRASIDVSAPAEAVTHFAGGRDDRAGSAVALVPDTGGDAVDEVLIGGPHARLRRGAAYLVYGRADLPPTVFLDNLGGPLGATLLTNIPEARAGFAVAGLADRDGDGRGDLAVGAPGGGDLDAAVAGVVFEVHLPAKPAGAAPRDLTCRILPGRKVSLSWINGGRYRALEVLRDDRPIAVLPADALYYIDTEPLAGVHAYRVRADKDPLLVSNPCRVELRSLLVFDLVCGQIPGTTRVGLKWRVGDVYTRLGVRVNERVLRDDLPGDATSFEFDPGPGSFVVEIYDPLNGPEGASARCEVKVIDLPAVEVTGLVCEVAAAPEGPAVDLRWDPNPSFTLYAILRDGIPLDLVLGNGFRDAHPPPGQRLYGVIGITGGVHFSEAARCAVLVPRTGAERVVSGRVVFDDPRKTPIAGGRLRALDGAGQLAGEGQPGADGRFEVVVVKGATPALLVFDVQVPALDGGDPRSAHRAAVETPLAEGVDAEVRVPLPVLAVAGLRERPERFRALLESLEGRRGADGRRRGALAFAIGGPAELPRTLEAVRGGIERLRAHLKTYLAAEPEQLDLVAHGFSGLGARAYLHAVATRGHPVRTLVLLGTPQLGTELAGLDALAAAPKRFFLGGPADREEDTYLAAAQQLPRYLAEFNRRFTNLRGARAHLVAGIGGEGAIDTVLGCREHDGRVCRESAQGGIPGAALHTTSDLHEELGRSPESLELLGRILDGAAGGEAAPAGGGGAPLEFKLEPGEVYSSILAEQTSGELELLSDTSGSIIIILNSELPGVIDFSVRTPDGTVVDPAAAGALPGVDYHSFGDGEGHLVQSYEFDPGQPGTYVALIANAGGPGDVPYSVQIYLDSRLSLAAALEAQEVALGGSALVTAAVDLNGAPVLGAAAEARVSRPDGGYDRVPLKDDGQGPDRAAGDGVYAGSIAGTAVAGLYLVSVRATGLEPLPFLREAKVELVVRSAAASFSGEFSSGTQDLEPDGLLEGVWVGGAVAAREPGVYLVLGTLTDRNGGPVATSGAMLSLASAQTAAFQLLFDGEEIYAARREGPYVLKRVELLDGNRGFVLCEGRTDALTTAPMAWTLFGGAVQRFKRGDANGDGAVDISDALAVLGHLFTSGVRLDCPDAGDANADRAIDIADAVYLLSALFLNGSPLPPPSPGCGLAPALGCPSYTACP